MNPAWETMLPKLCASMIVERDLRIEAPVVLDVAAIVAREPLELPAVGRREPRGREPEQQARKFVV